MKFNKVNEEYGLELGDEVLMGKYRNKRGIIKDFEFDKNNQPVIVTDKGKRAVYGFRVKKYMDGPSALEKYQAFFKAKLEEYGVSSPKKLAGSDKKKFWKELKVEWAVEKERVKEEKKDE